MGYTGGVQRTGVLGIWKLAECRRKCKRLLLSSRGIGVGWRRCGRWAGWWRRSRGGCGWGPGRRAVWCGGGWVASGGGGGCAGGAGDGGVIAMVRYQGALLARSVRWLPPVLLFAGTLVAG